MKELRLCAFAIRSIDCTLFGQRLTGLTFKKGDVVVFKYNFHYLCYMRKIIAYKNYFIDFVKKLSKEETNKIRRALDLFKTEDKMPRHFIKFIRDGIYEFRVNYGNNEFRIFFIYDGDTIVILFNAFKKKTQKTPDNEIKKAIKLKEEYYGTKGNK